MTRPEYRICIDASFADKVRAIRGLVELYRRRMPDRLTAIERALTGQDRPGVSADGATPR